MSDGDLIPTRRSYLKFTSAAVSAAAVGAGASGTAGAASSCTADSSTEESGSYTGSVEEDESTTDDEEEPEAEETDDADDEDYARVVDVVEAGADPNGGESITPVLEANRADDTLFRFPEGRYYMDDMVRWTGFENVGFEGDDATIVPASYHDFNGTNICFKLGTASSPGDSLHFSGIDFDFTADDTGARAIQAQVADDLVVRNVTVDGEHDSGTFGPFLFDVTSSSGEGTIENVRIPDGGEYSRYTPGSIKTGPTGILVSDSHQGHLRFQDCVVGPFPDNGLYAANGEKVSVIGGEYRNSNVASIRIGGDGSNVQDATVVVDQNRDDDETQMGIRLDRGEDLLVEDTTVELQSPNGNAIRVLNDVDSATISDSSLSVENRPENAIHVNPSAGSTHIHGTDIRQDTSAYAIVLTEQSSGGGDVLVEDVDVTGDGDGSNYRFTIYCGRDGTEFRSVSVEQQGGDWRRGLLVDADDCLVYGGDYYTEHHPIVNDGSGNRFVEIDDAQARNGSEGILLQGGNSDVDVIDNVIHSGLSDNGTSNLTTSGNEFP